MEFLSDIAPNITITLSEGMMKLKLWFYDCDYGQGSVRASTYEKAYTEALLDAGRHSGVRNVHLATKDEIEFRKVMGGNID